MSATFTFSADRAAGAAADAGEPCRLRRRAWTGAGCGWSPVRAWPQVWSQERRRARLVVRARRRARRPSPPASRSRPSATTCCRFPACPTRWRRSCARSPADGSTLPLPVPADGVTTSSAQVGGAPATVLATRDRTFAAVVWVEDGVMSAVAGALDADEVLSVARELR